MAFMDDLIDQLNSTFNTFDSMDDIVGAQRHSVVVTVPMEPPLTINKPLPPLPLRKKVSMSFLRQQSSTSSTSVQDAAPSPLTSDADHEPLKWAQPDISLGSPTSHNSWTSSTRKSSTTSMASTAASSVSAVSPSRLASRSLPVLLKHSKSISRLSGWRRRREDPSSRPPTPSIPSSPTRSRQASISTWDSDSTKSPFAQVEEYSQQLQRILSTRRSRKRTATPQAEIEMAPRMGDLNYFRAFTTNISVVTAICGSCIISHKPHPFQPTTLVTPTHKTPASDALTLALLTATDTAQILSALDSATLPDILFALHQSLTSISLPRVSVRQAKTLYKHTTAYQSTYSTRPWSRIRDLIPRIPIPCLVTLAFLVWVGRALDKRGVTVDGLRASVWLLRVMWPQIEVREVTDGDVEEGDAVTALLVDFSEELLGEVPGEVRGVRWKGGGRTERGEGLEMMKVFRDRGSV